MREPTWWMHCYYAMRYGKWSCGYGYWKGKPKFEFVHTYYDGYLNALHIGNFWIECDY